MGYFTLAGTPHKVAKLWGNEYWWVNTDKYCVKVLEIVPGYQCSLHYHNIKDETFLVQAGEIVLEQRDVRGIPFEEVLNPGDQRHITPRTPHRFRAVSTYRDCAAYVLEISTHHDDADVVRIEESKKL